MADDHILIDEIIITMTAPVDITDTHIATVRRTLMSKAFMRRVDRVVRGLVRQHRSLRFVRAKVSR